MREIKFRAWYEREMYFSAEENCCSWDNISDNGIVMQYTGLKDKNGLL